MCLIYCIYSKICLIFKRIIIFKDGHEICFVGEEAFCELSKVDCNASYLLEEAMKNDKSDEWYNKHGGKQIK